MRAMMAVTDAGTRHPQRFRRVCSAGEPLNPRRSAGFASSTATPCSTYYGLTESYRSSRNYPFMEVREGSMGKPMPGWDVQILDEDERPVGPGVRGENLPGAPRSNPHYPLGYWRQPRPRRRPSAATWFHSQGRRGGRRGRYIW